MAGKGEPGGISLRLPVHYGAITGLVYMPEVDAIIVSTVEGTFLVYDAASFKLLFEKSTRSRDIHTWFNLYNSYCCVTSRPCHVFLQR